MAAVSGRSRMTTLTRRRELQRYADHFRYRRCAGQSVSRASFDIGYVFNREILLRNQVPITEPNDSVLVRLGCNTSLANHGEDMSRGGRATHGIGQSSHQSVAHCAATSMHVAVLVVPGVIDAQRRVSRLARRCLCRSMSRVRTARATAVFL